MTKPLRVGVIGAGVWATTSHLPALRTRADDVQFVAACRLGEKELERLGTEFGFPILSEDYRDVLGAGVDMCIVSSPAAFHYEHAKAALLAGCHVLIEKPVTIEPAHAWELVELADRLRRHVVVSFGWLFMDTFVQARRLWDAYSIGPVEHVTVHMASAVRELLLGTRASSTGRDDDVADTATYTDPDLAGGGYSQTQLPHALSWLFGLTDLVVDDVYALGFSQSDPRMDLHDAAVLRFTGGGTGVVSGASYHHGAQRGRHQMEVRVFGERGQLHADLERDRLWLWREDGVDIESTLAPDAGIYSCDGPPLALLDLILGRRTDNPAPLALGARTVETLAALTTSTRTAQRVATWTARRSVRTHRPSINS